MPHDVIPLGFDAADFARVDVRRSRVAEFDPRDGFVHLCYVGTLLPLGVATAAALLTAFAKLRQMKFKR